MTDVAALGFQFDTTEADRATRSLDGVSKSARGTETATEKMNREFASSEKRLADTGRATTQATNSLNGMTNAAKRLGAALGVTLGAAAIVGGIRSSIRIYADFESQMARVGAVSRASASEMKLLTATARELGATTEFTASQAGEGLEFLARAGWSAQESIAAMPAVLNLSTAATLDLGRAADVASNIMSAYSIKAADASSVTDVLAAASSRANTDVQQLGDAMSYVGPVAAALNISMGDSAAAIGALSDAGIQGSSAGTGLRRVLSSLANPTAAARKEFAALGLEVADLNPASNDLVGIIDRLADSGISASQALTVFGDRGGPAILALVEQRFKVRELSADLRDVGGEAQRMADEIRDTLSGDLMGLTSALEDVRISLGQAFSPSARNSVQGMTGVVRSFGENINSILGALGLAAKAVTAYVIAVYTIPTAKAAASLATVAYSRVLALFAGQVALTTRSLLTMRNALNVVAAAFVGWEIGKYLRNEFEFVEKAGIALMSGLHRLAIRIGSEFSILGERIKFALTNPFSFARDAIADHLEWLAGLGAGTLKFLGLEGLADSIKTEFNGVRGATASDHNALIKEMRENSKREAGMVSDIYADMFADVGSSSRASAAAATDALGNIEEGTISTADAIDELTDAQKALQSAFESTLAQYHRQITLGEDATHVEQLLYEAQYGRLKGIGDQQRVMLRGMAEELDMRERLKQIESEQTEINQGRDSIARELMTEEERIRDSYQRRRDIVLAATYENEQARTELLLRLEAERDEQLLDINGSYWERYLAAAEENLQNFDVLAGNMLESFTGRFGDAFEKMVFDAQSLGDAARGMAEGMARSVINALGEMAAQWLAYQAVHLLVGKTTQSSAASTMTFNAMAAQQLAAINAYASAAAIPYTGYIAAPAAATAAIAATSPMVGAVASLSMAGVAHDGIDSIPREGTWLLDKGERVVDRRTNADLKEYLSGGGGAPQVTIHAPVTVEGQPGMSEEDSRAQGEQVAGAIRATIVSVLDKESRPGGMLWSMYGGGR